jgi:hypothetical protein
VLVREKALSEMSETEQMEDYERNMAWFKECRNGFVEWYDRQNKGQDKDDRKVLQICHCISTTAPWRFLSHE